MRRRPGPGEADKGRELGGAAEDKVPGCHSHVPAGPPLLLLTHFPAASLCAEWTSRVSLRAPQRGECFFWLFPHTRVCVAVSAHLSDFEPNVNHCRLDPTGWDVCPELQLLPFSLGLALLTPKGRAVDPKLLLQKGSLQDRRATTATATASGEACALGLH